MPYHDHPRQHVGLRVLSGQLQVDSCDIENDSQSPIVGREYRVTRKDSQVMSSDSDVLVVQPLVNNIHKITAHKDSMFLDFVVPPYSAGRSITYFREVEEPDKLVAVAERDVDLPMDFFDYRNLLSVS